MKTNRTKLIGAAMICFPLPFLFIFLTLEEHLLNFGYLNKRDLGFVGEESGTLNEYFTNVWHWDALACVLMLLVPIGFLIGAVIIWKESKPQH